MIEVKTKVQMVIGVYFAFTLQNYLVLTDTHRWYLYLKENQVTLADVPIPSHAASPAASSSKVASATAASAAKSAALDFTYVNSIAIFIVGEVEAFLRSKGPHGHAQMITAVENFRPFITSFIKEVINRPKWKETVARIRTTHANGMYISLSEFAHSRRSLLNVTRLGYHTSRQY